MPNTFLFIDSEFKNSHFLSEGAPCDWSREHGATHTLHIDADDSTRPARIAKSRIYVGLDENEVGGVAWETWTGRWERTIKGALPFE